MFCKNSTRDFDWCMNCDIYTLTIELLLEKAQSYPIEIQVIRRSPSINYSEQQFVIIRPKFNKIKTFIKCSRICPLLYAILTSYFFGSLDYAIEQSYNFYPRAGSDHEQ
jgi:hypothetical protein